MRLGRVKCHANPNAYSPDTLSQYINIPTRVKSLTK
jgi:hypothetical protein